MSFLITPSSLILENTSACTPRSQYQVAQNSWDPTSSLSNLNDEVVYDVQELWDHIPGLQRPAIARPSREQILSDLLKQAAAEKAAEQRREQRRKVMEAQIVALEMQRRREDEQRRAQIARERRIAAQQQEYLRRVLAYTAHIEQQKRIAEENRRRELKRIRERTTMQQRALRNASGPPAARRYIRVGDYLMEVKPDPNEGGLHSAESLKEKEQDDYLLSLCSAQNADQQQESSSLLIGDILPQSQARRAASINVPVTDRLENRTFNDSKQPIFVKDESVDMEKLINDACRALAEAISMPHDTVGRDTEPPHKDNETQGDCKEAETGSGESSEKLQAVSQDETADTKEAQLLFSYDFPSQDTDYGAKVRQIAKADSIDVEMTMDDGGSIRISGLWNKEAPTQPTSPPRSPKSAHVSDVDENEEEIEVVDIRPANSDRIELKHSETIPLPEHPERIRAELTDEGFRLWLDSV